MKKEINHSMEYDFAGILESLRQERAVRFEDPADLERHLAAIEAGFRSTGYQPHGDEVMKGACDTAGGLIRELLFGLMIGEPYRFMHVTSAKGEVLHDTTMVFDRQRGYWAIVNSKSPTKPYNLVPKDRLEELVH